MKKIVIALSLAIIGATSFTALAQKAPAEGSKPATEQTGRHGKDPMKAYEGLNLTPKQEADLKAMHDAERADRAKAHASHKEGKNGKNGKNGYGCSNGKNCASCPGAKDCKKRKDGKMAKQGKQHDSKRFRNADMTARSGKHGKHGNPELRGKRLATIKSILTENQYRTYLENNYIHAKK